MRRMPRDLNVRDVVFALPEIGKLLWRVMRDERVPVWVRGGLVATAAYLALPVDVVPDWVPVLGQMDDVLLITLGVRSLLRRVPEDIVAEHWDGDEQVLAKLLGNEPEAEEGPTRT